MTGGLPNLLLSGPPGVGKSSIGRTLAKKTGACAIDLDEAIEERVKRSVQAILRSDGEAAFREIEAHALEALDPSLEIVCLGGGTLTTSRGRAAARGRGTLFGLVARPETLERRLAASGIDRPLLQATPLRELIAARERSYAAVDRRIEAEGTVDEVADRVAESARSLELVFAHVGGKKSRILLGRDLVQAFAGAIAALAPTRPVLAIADRGVPERLRARYLGEVRALFAVHEIAVEGGEGVKTWASLGGILEGALAAGCGRQSVVCAIGGGATCDLAALAASLLGRGAPVVLAPTTLLAQVDASVGGKSAVNMAAGRNLVGAFHPAEDVIADQDFLASLPKEELRSGLAELLKIAIIRDARLFEEVVARAGEVSAATIAQAIRHKAAIVARDPFEKGERKLLNLGHTLGHALESASDFSIRHGEAVAIGTAAICRYSVSRGWMSEQERTRVIAGLERAGLPVWAAPELLSRSTTFLARDKKADGESVDIVAVHEVGKVSLKRVSLSEIVDLVRFGGRA
jgi:shikimate kinase / 3-dehydroquinate synthase